MIDLPGYTKFNDSVDLYEDAIKPVIYLLGMMGEFGEYCNKYKKIFRDHHGEMDKRQKDFALELGDIAWYFERLCKWQGYSLSEILEMNMEKLKSRKERGKIGGDGDNR